MPRRVPTFKPRSCDVPVPQPLREDTDHRRFINGRAWRRCAKSYLRRHPCCVRCEARGELVAATEVHHTRGEDPEFLFDETTFEALCSRCHSQETRLQMNRAGSNRP